MKLARNVSFAILLMGTVLCLHGAAHSAPAQGEDANRKVVRIAYQESNRLMDGLLHRRRDRTDGTSSFFHIKLEE